MKNPFARLREECKIGQREFERKYEFSHTVMASIESGLYPDLSEYMIECLGRECAEKGIEAGRILWNEYGQATLQDAYHVWQTAMRALSKPMLKDIDALTTYGKDSPMLQLVTQRFGNPRAFCTTLKVPTATLTRYLSGVTQTMPKSIEQALIEGGIAKKNLTFLKEAQEIWTADHA